MAGVLAEQVQGVGKSRSITARLDLDVTREHHQRLT